MDTINAIAKAPGERERERERAREARVCYGRNAGDADESAYGTKAKRTQLIR